ncbi:hypothetical protein JCM21900_002031 [Sporobolomyces salmonicolor]
MAPIRVLGFPGFAQSASTMTGKLSKARAIFGDDIEFVAIEPPDPLAEPTISNGTRALAEGSRPSHNPRPWWDWSSHESFKNPSEISFALAHVRAFLERNDPSDACIGFSQGGAMTVILLALFERPWLHPIWQAPAKDGATWPPPPFKAAILCSAFGPGDPEYAAWFKEERPAVPTLHVIGKNDVVDNPSHHIPRKPYFSHLFNGWGSPADSVAIDNVSLPPLSPDLSTAHI